MSEDNVLLCPCGMRGKVICDRARGLSTFRGGGEGPVVSGAAPLGGPLALHFNLPLRGESISYYITLHFFSHLHPGQRKQICA